MMTAESVIYIGDDYSVHVTDIERDSAGRIVGAYVINGAWWLAVDGSKIYACERKNGPIVTIIENASITREVAIPAGTRNPFEYAEEQRSRRTGADAGRGDA